MKVFILIKQYPYEGDAHGPAFSSEELAKEHAQALNAEQQHNDESWEVEEWDVLDETPTVVDYVVIQTEFDQDGREVNRQVFERTQWSYMPPVTEQAVYSSTTTEPPFVYINGYAETQLRANELIEGKKEEAIKHLKNIIKRRKGRK